MANNVNKHRQNYVKVNVSVDEGMKGLITTLRSFELLETVECCEGHENRNAWVCFRYGSYWGHPWRELVNFVLGFLAPGLVSIVGDDVNVRIQVTAGGQIFGELSIRPGAINRVANTLYLLVKHFNVFQYHNSGCCGDNSDTPLLHY